MMTSHAFEGIVNITFLVTVLRAKMYTYYSIRCIEYKVQATAS